MAHGVTSVRLDEALGHYYKHMGAHTYKQNGVGKFLAFFLEQDYEEDALEDELGDDGNFEDCELIEFDADFPLKKGNLTEQEKSKQIFLILQNCYKHGTWYNPLDVVEDSKPIPKLTLSKPPPPKKAPPLLSQNTALFKEQLGQAELESWLQQVKFDQYYQLLINKGYNSLEKVRQIQNRNVLADIGIPLKGHTTKMYADIERLRKPDHKDEQKGNLSDAMKKMTQSMTHHLNHIPLSHLLAKYP
eukprot:457824_1